LAGHRQATGWTEPRRYVIIKPYTEIKNEPIVLCIKKGYKVSIGKAEVVTGGKDKV